MSALFHRKVQLRSEGHCTSGSKRAMVVVTQRNRPGMGQLSVKGSCRQGAGAAAMERMVSCQWTTEAYAQVDLLGSPRCRGI